MMKPFSIQDVVDGGADSELLELLARTHTVRQRSNEVREIDYSFTLILIGFFASTDPVSRWFQEYTKAAGIKSDAIYGAKSVTREAVEGAVPSTVPFNKQGDVTQSAQSIFDEASRFRQQTVGEAQETTLLGVRHVMAAYIYGPGTHEQQLRDYGFDRVNWSNSFLSFIRQRYPQDDFEAWRHIHVFQFSQEPVLSDKNSMDGSAPDVSATQEATAQNANPDASHVRATREVKVRKAPSSDAPVLGVLNPDETCPVVGLSGDWYQIDFKAQIGYVSAQFVTIIPKTPTKPVTPAYRVQRPWNDASEGADLLNVTSEAHALADMLLLRDFDPPICAGIFGGWGSGKSFFMHLLYERMAYIRSLAISHDDPWSKEAAVSYPQVGHVYLIRFDAWTYAKSNLWVSLVQTLFYELNRQLSIENHLSNSGENDLRSDDNHSRSGADILKSGDFWPALFSVSQADSEKLTNADFLHEVVAKWQKGPGSSAEDVLWQTLNSVQQKQRAYKKEEYDKATQKLDESLRVLAAAKKNLENFDRYGDVATDYEALRETVVNELKMGGAFDRVSVPVREALKEANKPIGVAQSIGLVLREVAASRFNIAVVIILVVLAFFVVLGGMDLVAETMRLGAQAVARVLALIVGLFNFTIVLPPVINLIRKWNDKAQELYQSYRQNQSRLHNEKKDALQQVVTDRQQAVAKQEAEVLLVQQQAALTIRYKSVSDFVARRSKDLLDEDLGVLHEIQHDLHELTEVFGQGKSREDAVGEEFRKKFPRGPVRAVLFIDDLDRCPPDKVVEVLEATQLLLKTKLFVVVLALDIRFVSRALEKQYDQILTRNGSPSGLDYIEKIIQIPYHMRPIAPTAVNQYLTAQMDVADPSDRPSAPHSNVDVSPDSSIPDNSPSREPFSSTQHSSPTENSTAQSGRRPIAPQPLPIEVAKFSQKDFDIVESCCQQIEMVPRAIKRLINVSKLLKLIWSRPPHGPLTNYDQVFKAAVFMLACSERYPHLMLSIFEELISKGRLAANDNKATLYKTFVDYTPEHMRTRHQQRQWEELKSIAQTSNALPTELTFAGMSLENLNLVRSFCFLGDIVDDPNDRDSIDSLSKLSV